VEISSLLGSAGIGGAIGAAIVRLELDTKKYVAELETAKAQTVAGTNTMATGTSKFAGLAKTAFLGAGVAAVAFGAYAVKSAIEAADAQNKLANTFANNAMLSDSSMEAFNRQAGALRDLTGVDDEAITVSQAMLGQFKITGQQVEELTPLIVDLSAKMGIDLAAATKSVGKAVIGNTAGLQRYGIVIEEASGKGSEFQSVVEGLQGTVGGFARERAIDEPWRILGAQFEEIAEQVGTVLLPALQGLADWLIQYGIPALQGFIDVVGIAADPDTYTDIPIIGEAFKALGVGIQAVGDATTYADDTVRRNGLPLLSEMKQMADLASTGLTNLGDSSTYASSTLEAAAPSFRKLGKAAKGIRDDIAAELPGIIGTVTTMKETFDISPKDLVDITQSWKQIGKRIAQDLRIIGNADLQPAVRQAILALPPEMRDAFARGNESVRGAIVKNIKETLDTKQAIPDLAASALRGSKTVGNQMIVGLVQGLESGQGTLNSAATSVINRAIAAMRVAAVVKSPSKKTYLLGTELMKGLADGISDSEQKAVDAAKAAMDKVISGLQSALSKIQGKASAFGGTISGGFSSFGDLSNLIGLFGPEGAPGFPVSGISSTLGGQVDIARQFSDILKALQTQGASKGLLSQIAQAGPEGIPFAQALLQGGPELIETVSGQLKELQDISSKTAKSLTQDFFGDQMGKLREKLDRIGDRLDRLVELEKIGHSHDIVVDGKRLAEATRQNALAGGKRNGGSTGF
jgi:hypothetical protein